jgi:hypothetical protein
VPIIGSQRVTVALAVSGHGFGHAVRAAEVARALLQAGARVIVRTDAPRWLFPPAVELAPPQPAPLDVGVVQHDGLDFDIAATRARWVDFARSFDSRAAAEARWLQAAGVDVVLGDVPPLAFAAAHQAGIPSLAVANFGWDWIYAAWPDFDQAIASVQTGYRQADLLLRLPLHSPTSDAFAAFRQIVDIPLIARRATRDRDTVRAELGLPAERPVVLISFGGFAAAGFDVAALAASGGYTFVVTPPLTVAGAVPARIRVLDRPPDDYVSLVAACDVVVTKPGYGIVADCLANDVAVLFTDRGPFREYDVLADALPRLGRARYVPRADVLAGRLGADLDALLAQPRSLSTLDFSGAAAVAEWALRVAKPGNVLAAPARLSPPPPSGREPTSGQPALSP